jgi:ribosome-binding ATPase YchF (GTP1/OBG family)
MKNKYTELVFKKASDEGAVALAICAKAEADLSELNEDEQIEFLHELGLKDSGLNRLAKAGYDLLGLASFLTAGPDESRAWTIKKNCLAPQAAGVIHTDFERGFIRAEVMSFADLEKLKSPKAVKDAGLLRSEGKGYHVQDGDIIEFKFNV